MSKLVKQHQRRFRPELMESIEAEVKKLMQYDFVQKGQYPDWLANIVSIPKKNRKNWICINFPDLNIECHKDEFLLTIIDVMIDNTFRFERISFMDRLSRYNQIKM